MTLWQALALVLASVIVGEFAVLTFYVLRPRDHSWLATFQRLDRRVDDVETSVAQLAKAVSDHRRQVDAELRQIKEALAGYEIQRQQDVTRVIDAVVKTNQAVLHLADMVRALLPPEAA